MFLFTLSFLKIKLKKQDLHLIVLHDIPIYKLKCLFQFRVWMNEWKPRKGAVCSSSSSTYYLVVAKEIHTGTHTQYRPSIPLLWFYTMNYLHFLEHFPNHFCLHSSFTSTSYFRTFFYFHDAIIFWQGKSSCPKWCLLGSLFVFGKNFTESSPSRSLATWVGGLAIN